MTLTSREFEICPPAPYPKPDVHLPEVPTAHIKLHTPGDFSHFSYKGDNTLC